MAGDFGEDDSLLDVCPAHVGDTGCGDGFSDDEIDFDSPGTGDEELGDEWTDGDDEWGWTNGDAPWDVNGDKFVSPVDALLVVNYLNAGNSGALDPRGAGSTFPYFDVNGDSFVSPIDALSVINRLNQGTTTVSTTEVAQRMVEPGDDSGSDPQPNPELEGDLHVDDIGADATPIELEDGAFGFVDAMVNSEDDRDVFQMTLDDPGTVYVDLFSFGDELDTHLQVFYADGAIVSDNNDSYDSTDSSLILELDAGTYYLVATSYKEASMGEYGLDVFVVSYWDFGLPIHELPEDEGDEFRADEFDDPFGNGGFAFKRSASGLVGRDDHRQHGSADMRLHAIDEVIGESIDWRSTELGIA